MRISPKKTIIESHQVDRTFLGLISGLVLFGLLMVYEASSIYSDQVFGGKYHFLIQQTGWMFIGYVGMIILYRVNIGFLKHISPYLFIGVLVLLGFTLLPTFFTPAVYGARRWIFLNPAPLPMIPGIGRVGFQPSELAKLVGITFFASFLSNQGVAKSSRWILLRNFNIALFTVVGLVLLQPDFTTAAIIGVIFVAMYFLANGELFYFLFFGPLLAVSAGIYAFSSEYRRLRIQTLLNPENSDKLGAGYHIRQIMIALGSGGFLGLGLGKSRQKYAYLPEVQSDSIFAIIGEELGFIGTTIIVSLFLFLIWRGLKIAQSAESLYESLLASGVIIWVGIQVLINLGAMARLIPLTGVPLPLISYGGSSTIFMLWGLGLVLNVSRRSGQ